MKCMLAAYAFSHHFKIVRISLPGELARRSRPAADLVVEDAEEREGVGRQVPGAAARGL